MTVFSSQDEGKFDPSSIPLKSWQEFENELWEQGSNQSIGELLAAGQRDGDSRYGAESMYGMEVPVPYGASRGSPSLSQHNMMQFDGQSQYGGGMGGQSQYGGSMLGLQQQGGMMPSAVSRGSMMSMGQGSMGGRRDSYMSQGTGMMGGMGTHGSGSQLGLAQYGAGGGGGAYGQLPGDHQIVADTQRILAGANLQTLTKKGVRQELEAMYGCELGERRALVNGCIEETLGLA